MDVMPQLMQVNQTKLIHPHEDLEVEVEVEEALLKRRSTTNRTISDGSTLTTLSSTSTGVSASSSSEDFSAELHNSKIDEPITEEKQEHSVYLDKNEGTGVEWSQFNVKVDDLAAKLNENVDTQQVLHFVEPVLHGKAVGNLTGPSRKEPETSATYELEGSDEEVVELEFERAVDKMHTHNDYNMYCPNCSSQITKVVLRRKIKRRVRVQSEDERRDLFGCLSCFRVFVSSGNRLNPFRIFRDPEENNQLFQEQPTSDVTVPTSGSTRAAASSVQSFWPFKWGKDNANALTSPPLTTEEAQSSSTTIISKPRDEGIEKESPIDGMKKPEQPELLVVTAMTNTYWQPEEILTDGTKEPEQPELSVVTGMPDTYYPQEGNYVIIPVPDTGTDATSPLVVTEPGSSRSLEIVKSIVYGGLIESMASLSVVSSAAASDATTLNIVTLGLANLVGGLVVLFHNLRDLRFGESNETNEERYKEELGRKEHFLLHATVAVLSYIIFGLIPPVIYGFTFRETNDRDYKMLAVAAAAFLCIFILSIAKAFSRGQHEFTTYFKTVLYYLSSAIVVSGVAFAVGDLTKKFIEQLGWLEPAPAEPQSFQSTSLASY